MAHTVSKKLEDNCWTLTDGTCFTGEFKHTGNNDPQTECYDDGDGYGDMHIFNAIKTRT